MKFYLYLGTLFQIKLSSMNREFPSAACEFHSPLCSEQKMAVLGYLRSNACGSEKTVRLKHGVEICTVYINIIYIYLKRNIITWFSLTIIPHVLNMAFARLYVTMKLYGNIWKPATNIDMTVMKLIQLSNKEGIPRFVPSLKLQQTPPENGGSWKLEDDSFPFLGSCLFLGGNGILVLGRCILFSSGAIHSGSHFSFLHTLDSWWLVDLPPNPTYPSRYKALVNPY